jgi:hypothetical protein
MRPYLNTAKLMRPSNMKRFPTPGPAHCTRSILDFANLTGGLLRQLHKPRSASMMNYFCQLFNEREVNCVGQTETHIAQSLVPNHNYLNFRFILKS